MEFLSIGDKKNIKEDYSEFFRRYHAKKQSFPCSN